jgi:hypothetical protein
MCIASFVDMADLVCQNESGFYSLATTPDIDNATSSTSVMPFTLTPTNSNKTKHEPLSKTLFRSNTPKTKSLKHTLEEAFVEGSAKQNEILKQVKMLKYEHAMGELDLKCRKLDHKAMEK